MRMSWFDASGIASLAKTALKEAQKTIDKALDIKDEDEQLPSNYNQVSPVEESDSFFTSWGLKSPTRSLKSNSSVEIEDDGNDSGISEKASGSGLTSVMSSSLWGSFTGSFFENARTPDNDGIGNDCIPVSSQPKRTYVSPVADGSSYSSSDSCKSLGNHSNGEKKTRRFSKNSVKVDGVVEGVDDEEVDAFSDSRVMLVVRDDEEDEYPLLSSKESKFNIIKEVESTESQSGDDKKPSFGNGYSCDTLYRSTLEGSIKESCQTIAENAARPSSLPERDDEAASPSSLTSSSVSSPSPSRDEGGTAGGKRSSESVEVLGSCEEGCATSPEGDLGIAIIESVPVHAHGQNPLGFIRLPSVPLAGGVGCENKDGSSSSVLEGNGFRFNCHMGKDIKKRALEEEASIGIKSVAAVKNWECRSEDVDAASGNGSPESVEVIPEDMVTTPSSVEVIGGSESSTTPSVSASVSTRPSSSSSSISPTTPGSGGCPPVGIRDEVSSVIHSVVPIGAAPSTEGVSETGGKKLDVVVDDISPESVELITEEDEEMSSSASSTTTTTAVTVLEQQKALIGVGSASVLVNTSIERSSKEDGLNEKHLRSFKGNCDNEKSGNESSYLRTLLADAMLEKEESRGEANTPPREQSPLSSERSDLVKVGEMSGQTSGDEELDTTTSSDIEIISSPNGGDSSSNKSESRKRGMTAKLSCTSRPMGASPSPSTASSSSSSSSFSMVGRGMHLAKDHVASAGHLEFREAYRGHHLLHYSQRYPSGNQMMDCNPAVPSNQVEELLKRISEISDILEARESKLIELSRTNVELQEQNMDLIRKLKDAELESSEREMARIEFEGRLATLDRKLQQGNSENEMLKMRLKEALDELSHRGSGEVAVLLREKEEECRELREEGEKLSKQEMNLTTMIKNLRTAQRNSEKTIANLRQHLEECENEVDRTKKSLDAREGVERAQVEAIHNLKSTLEAREEEMTELQSAIENERKTLKEEKRLLEEEMEHWSEREMSLLAEVQMSRMETERLRDTLTKVQEEHARRDEDQRVERQVLERRLVEVEARGEEVGAQASRATRPLLRQLESLQTMTRQREAAWEANERELLGKLAEAEGKAKQAMDRERNGRQRCATLSSRVTSLESQMMALRKEIEAEAAKFSEELESKDRELAGLRVDKINFEQALAEAKRSNLSLKECLAIERAAVEAEKRRNTLLQEQLREYLQQKEQQNQHTHQKGCSPRSSPALSFGHASIDDSVTGSTWLPLFQEDAYHDGVNSLFEGRIMGASSSSLIESLQSQLKLRDGEVQQLQWELGRGEGERNALTAEVSSLTAKLLEIEASLASAKADNSRLTELQTKYDALLQMYGEKVEETEELRLDLQDIKEMYKSQIDQLTKKGGNI